MKQIRYMMKDIKSNKIISFFLLGLSIIMMMLFVNLFDAIHHTQENLESVVRFRNMKAYIMQDSTEQLQFEKIYSDELAAVNKMENFLRDMRTNGVEFYTQYGYEMYVSEYGNIVRQESVTDNFFELFGMTTVEGRLFTKEEYDEAFEVVPIVIGYNLNSEYQVGKVYEFVNGGTGETFKGEVIGRLQKNSTYMEFNNSFEMNYSVDDSYIIPLGLKDYQDENMDFADCDMALTSMVILSDNVEFVYDGIKEMDLFELSLLNIQERFDEVVSAETNYLYIIIAISVVLLLLILSIMWIIFNRLIKKQLYEYGIHLLCGAPIATLVNRIGCFIYFMLGVSIIITCVLLKSMKEILPLCGVAVLLGVVILIYPAYKLKYCRILQVMKNI